MFESLEDRVVLSAAPCELPVAAPIATAEMEIDVSELPPDVFSLHSYPAPQGIYKAIYLDFDGHVTEGTSWNYIQPTIVTPPYDIDGDPTTFSLLEQDRIHEIWQRVSEDFSPFQVDVTTEEPDGNTLKGNGIRVAIGGNSEWYVLRVGGVAFMNSFNDQVDTPTYVFPENLGNGHPRYTAEAASHEVGHTLGLHHDGSPDGEYYRGHNHWAPIMGVGYYKSMVQWDAGEYPGSNNQEDDLAVINQNLLRRPDWVDQAFASEEVHHAGVIEHRDDVDRFFFATSGGPIDLQINTTGGISNLNMIVELTSSDGRSIYNTSVLGRKSLQIVADLEPGEYELSIDGTFGLGTYTDYGSIGQYFIDGTLPELV